MKGSLKLRPRRAITRSEAWACFSANLAMPGSGSLAAGHAIGYAQIAASFLAEIFTCVAGIPMLKWALSGGVASSSLSDNSFQNLAELWIHARWPLLGVALFALSVLWAMMTSFSILSGAPKDGVPPRIV